MKINIIVAVGENNVIGNQGKLPWHISDDLKRFKSLTEGKVVVMSKKTYESIGGPLPNRINIVISSGGPIPGCVVVSNPQTIFDMTFDEIFVMGGQQVYEYFLPMANTIQLTHVYGEFVGDTFFPEINLNEWEEVNYTPSNNDTSELKWGYSEYVRKSF